MNSNAAPDPERLGMIGEEAFLRLKASGATPLPRAYELWFAVAAGEQPALADAVSSIVNSNGMLTDKDVDALYETHIAPKNFSAHAERTSRGVLSEIDHVMEMIDLALGSSARYGESLVTLSNDLSGTADRSKIREIVGALVLATREAAATNKTLEAHLVESKSEIYSLRETLEAVRIEALTDPVTGLANRKHFDEMLMKTIDHATIHRTPVALLMADVDHFKMFNQAHGQLTGDQVLRLIGMTIRDMVKLKATIARFGGEEFAIILPDTTIDTARTIADSIRQKVFARELVKRSTGVSLGRITLSFGAASLMRGDTAATLLERADRCLRLAKNEGRNRTMTQLQLPSMPGDASAESAVA